MRQFLVKGGRNEGEGGPLKEDCKREAMKSNREKNRSRREKGNAGRRAGEMCAARLEKCEISGELKGRPEDAMLKDGGVYVVAGMPGVDEKQGRDAVFYRNEEGGVLEVFRRSVPEREMERRQRLPKVCAFGDFLRVLGSFAGDGCLSRAGNGDKPGRLKAFRELEKLTALCAPEILGVERIFPVGRVCLRRGNRLLEPEEGGVCEGIVIDLSDLFK